MHKPEIYEFESLMRSNFQIFSFLEIQKMGTESLKQLIMLPYKSSSDFSGYPLLLGTRVMIRLPEYLMVLFITFY